MLLPKNAAYSLTFLLGSRIEVWGLEGADELWLDLAYVLFRVLDDVSSEQHGKEWSDLYVNGD